ncbi:MAG: galactokinase [Phycisphaeraceae bacterium]|nr:galactokinase [Phycisphaeraceae bacterium]
MAADTDAPSSAADTVDRAHRAFAARFGRRADAIAWAPGRANLIGDHVDYQDGLVLPIAIGAGVAVAAARRPGAVLRAVAMDVSRARHADGAGPEAADPDHLEWPIGTSPPPDGAGWTRHVIGTASMLRQEVGPVPAGADLLITGDVPQGGGLGSSAALGVALTLAMSALSGHAMDAHAVARCARMAEHRFVGTPCGPMDQLASLFGRRGHALEIDCRTCRVTPVHMPSSDRMRILLIDTGTRHALATGAYAGRRRETEDAAKRLGVASLRGLASGDGRLMDLSRVLPDRLAARARHVISEIDRVALAAEALRAADAEEFGALLRESHQSLSTDFEVSCPELDVAVDAACRAGAFGARMTGAGFGGCAIAAVPPARVGSVVRDVASAFRAAGFAPPVIRAIAAGDGARVIPAPTA